MGMKALDEITSRGASKGRSPNKGVFSGFGAPDLEKIYSENSEDTFGEKKISEFNTKLKFDQRKLNATAQNGFWGAEQNDYTE